VILIGFVYSALTGNDSSKTPPPTSPPVTRETALKNAYINMVKIEKFSWNRSGFDNIMLLDATIKNHSQTRVKDIEITCRHFSKSGTDLDSNKRVIYEIFEPGKTKKISDFNMGFIHSQAHKTYCSVTNLVVIE
jgi:hypothetical protein